MILKSRTKFLFFILFLLVSCSNKSKMEVFPAGFTTDSIISEPKMVCIMVDVHIVEAALLIERNEGIVSREKTSLLYDGIFSKYHISRSLYEKNLTFYSLNPELFAKMYEKVIAQLQNQQKRFIPEN